MSVTAEAERYTKRRCLREALRQLECKGLIDERKLRIRRSWKTYREEGKVNGILSGWPKITNLVTSKI